MWSAHRVIVVLAAGSLCILAGLWLMDRLLPLPLDETRPARVVVAEDGTPLWRFADQNGVWRYPVTLDDVSPRYLQALLGYEDRWFWYHPGINPFALLRAAGQNLHSRKIISGGSTLTMQVARLIDPQPRSLRGKLIQAWRALQLEWHLSKRQILTLYLNRAPFGGTLEGLGAASWSLLGKPPVSLTYGEAALLAALPQAPGRLRPDRWPERARAARDKVLQRLADEHIWSSKVVAEVRQEPIWLTPPQTPALAPLFARRVLRLSTDNKIITTLDASLQRQLESMAQGWKNNLPPHTSLAVLVVDHTDMKVRAWLGSLDFNDDSRFGHVDMPGSIRSPGSTLKPFLYGLALDEGLISAESLLQDVPRRFGDYRPGNFDTGFHGPVSASEALTRSLNLPAVQLLEAYGPKKMTAALRNAGLTLRFPVGAEPNLSLILGGTGVRMDQMVATYGALARHGQVAPLRLLPGQPLVERRLMSPGAAWIIRRIMAGEAQPQPDAVLPAVVPLAWKTGTSYGYRDAWAIGINARYLMGVWVGRPDGTPVAGQYGLATAVPVLNQIDHLLMSSPQLLGRQLPVDLRPASVTSQTLCWPGGQPLLAGDINCRQRHQSWILNDTLPPTILAEGQEGMMGLHQTLWLNPAGQRVAANCPDARPQAMILWPLPLEAWLPAAERRINRLPPVDPHCPPGKGNGMAPLLLTGLRDGQILQRLTGKSDLVVRVTLQGGEGKGRWWFLNGEILSDTTDRISRVLTFNQPGVYQLSVLDETGQVITVTFTVR